MKLLCTHPADPALGDLPPAGAGEYLGELEALLATAEGTVDIVCPFIDGVGAGVLEAADERAGSSATWRVFTRDAPEALVEAAQRRDWILYEYRGSDTSTRGRGFHCKLFLVDQRAAILGSTNLIYTNLVENVELGVLVDDEAVVAQLSAVPRALRRVSETLVAGDD